MLRDVSYCEPYYDGFLCWGPTPAGETAIQNCPPARLSDTTRQAIRICGSGAKWLSRRQNESSATGWTNYSNCFPLAVKNFFDKVSEDENAQTKFNIALTSRYLDIVGFSISLIALLVSFFIFRKYRSLRNDRTRIRMSLFSAMILQVLIRLIVYIVQANIRQTLGSDSALLNSSIFGIDTEYICLTSHVLQEYAITVVFLCMFFEGLYTNYLVTSTGLVKKMPHVFYLFVGWGLPALITAIWAVATNEHYRNQEVNTCWYGNIFEPYLYWILQTPRLALIVLNFGFLLNIQRVLVSKLRKNEADARSTDSNRTKLHHKQIIKALRAAFILLPLLGVTYAMEMTEGPLDSNVWVFGLWSYCAHFLRSFQGLFIALIYCFLNTEVRKVIKKKYQISKAIAETRRRQAYLYRKNGTNAVPAKTTIQQTSLDPADKGVILRPLHWKRNYLHGQYTPTAGNGENITKPSTPARTPVNRGITLRPLRTKRINVHSPYEETALIAEALATKPRKQERSSSDRGTLTPSQLLSRSRETSIDAVEQLRRSSKIPTYIIPFRFFFWKIRNLAARSKKAIFDGPKESKPHKREIPLRQIRNSGHTRYTDTDICDKPYKIHEPSTSIFSPPEEPFQTIVTIETDRASASSSPVKSTPEAKIIQTVVTIESDRPLGRIATDPAAKEESLRPPSCTGSSDAQNPITFNDDSITFIDDCITTDL